MRVQIVNGQAQGKVDSVNGSGGLEVTMDSTAHCTLGLSEIIVIGNKRSDMFVYEVKKLDQGTGLICPRKGCGGKFLVNLPKLKEMKTSQTPQIRGIACPYCSRVSTLPEWQ